jgi:hypothetical protein
MTIKTDAPPVAPAVPVAASRLRLPGHALWLPVLLLALAAYYLVSYALSRERPAGALLGWLGWADQSAYQLSITAFAHGDLSSTHNFIYPPLYPLMAAPFMPLLARHAFLIEDLACFLAAFGALLAISRRLYGQVLPVLVCVALFAFAPILTIQQWVIPWTSSLAAALGTVLLLIYAGAERGPEPFRLRLRRDWTRFGLFFLAYGALAATRPLEIVVWLPLATTMFLRTAWATTVAEPGAGRRAVRLAEVGLLAAGCAAVFVAFYLGFNEKVHHSLFGIYGAATLGKGYFVDRIPERLFSFLWNSSAAFAEPGNALFERFPLFGPILALCLVTLLTVRDVRFWVVATAFLHFLIYLPYGDLLPNGFFRYYNLHYFKWAYPWLAVIAAGQALIWARAALAGKWRGWAALAAAAAVTLAGWLLQLEPVNLTIAPDSLTARSIVSIAVPAPRKVEFVDIPQVHGSFDEIYSGKHQLWVDGRAVSGFRLIPMSRGARLLLLEPRVMSRVQLRLDPRLAMEPDAGRSILGETAIMPAAFYRAPRTTVGWTRGRIDFVFRAGGDDHGVLLDPLTWGEPEPIGRWTMAHRAVIGFEAPGAPGDIRVSSTVTPLTNHAAWGVRPRISLWINGCRIAKARVDRDGGRILQGVLSAHCRKPDGGMQVEWRATAIYQPDRLHMNADVRNLGVAVADLSLVQSGVSGG